MSFDFIYLASQSPRRAQLLEQIGVRFELLLPQTGEDAEALEVEHPGEAPAAYVQRVTAHKLDAALARRLRLGRPDAPVLCADTTVALDGCILGKPRDAAHACALLSRLAGRSHQVHTAIALGWGAQRLSALSSTEVQVAPMTPAQIQAYVASGEPMGKAGAYAIQGRMAAHVAALHGSYSGVMGLPLFELAQLLRQLGGCV